MDRELQCSLMRRSLGHLATGATDLAASVHRQPVSTWTSPAQAQREWEVLFSRYPLLMGMGCQIPRPGDFFTEERCGVPIVVVRGDDGVVRAFRNACRHRGARVAEGQGCRNRFVCPYHGWTYAADGRLVGVPDKASFGPIDQAAHGLIALPCQERHGMIWVSVTPREDGASTLDVAGHLGPLDAELAGYHMADHHHFETRVIQRRMNWKMVIDTFLEPYHFAVLHRTTVAPLLMPNMCLFEPIGMHLREVLPRRSLETQKGLPESEWDFFKHHTLVYVLFPNTVFVSQTGHIETWRVFPIPGKVDECVMYLDFYTPTPVETEKARLHWQRNLDLTIQTVDEEDFPASEGMLRNFLAGAPQEAVFGRNEPALAHFERTVTERLSAA